MKSLVSFICFILLINLSSVAQEIKGGRITYEQIIDYQLEGAYDDPAWDNYIAGLPPQGKMVYHLYFTNEEALYEKNPEQEQVLSPRLTSALKKVNYRRPQEEVQQVYVNLAETELIEQVEFMTRPFRIIADQRKMAWKLTGKNKKVLDYICMGAELISGEETLTAWFTTEIPISAGPAGYHGLPGMILGLEKNEEVFLLATAVDFTPPEDKLSGRLHKGQEYTRRKFDQLKTEKIEEYQRSLKSKSSKGEKKGKNE